MLIFCEFLKGEQTYRTHCRCYVFPNMSCFCKTWDLFHVDTLLEFLNVEKKKKFFKVCVTAEIIHSVVRDNNKTLLWRGVLLGITMERKRTMWKVVMKNVLYPWIFSIFRATSGSCYNKIFVYQKLVWWTADQGGNNTC